MALPDEPQLVEVPAFCVIGFQARTTNAAEASGKGVIGPTIGKFKAHAAEIPGVADKSVTYAVYSGYESDFNGAYDYLMGNAAQAGATPPEGMKKIELPAAKYLVFPSAGVGAPEVIATWGRVWKYFSGSAKWQRAYTADFEKYTPDGMKIYIAVK